MGHLGRYHMRNRRIPTSFFHFYYEFQPYGWAELELHNSTRTQKHPEAWMKARLHTCAVSSSWNLRTQAIETISKEKKRNFEKQLPTSWRGKRNLTKKWKTKADHKSTDKLFSQLQSCGRTSSLAGILKCAATSQLCETETCGAVVLGFYNSRSTENGNALNT